MSYGLGHKLSDELKPYAQKLFDATMNQKRMPLSIDVFDSPCFDEDILSIRFQPLECRMVTRSFK
jgi:hypothetical protein